MDGTDGQPTRPPTRAEKLNWKIRSKAYDVYRKFCYVLPHKWHLVDGGFWTTNISWPISYRTAHIICRRCHIHLFNGISEIKYNKKDVSNFIIAEDKKSE